MKTNERRAGDQLKIGSELTIFCSCPSSVYQDILSHIPCENKLCLITHFYEMTSNLVRKFLSFSNLLDSPIDVLLRACLSNLTPRNTRSVGLHYFRDFVNPPRIFYSLIHKKLVCSVLNMTLNNHRPVSLPHFRLWEALRLPKGS
jgi:hypothetical protein